MQLLQILLVSYPITPLIAFAHHIFSLAGFLRKDVFVRYRLGGGPGAPTFFGDGVVENFATGQIELERQVRSVLNFIGDARMERTFNACRYPSKSFKRWLYELSLYEKDPKVVLEQVEILFSRCLEGELDIRDSATFDQIALEPYPKPLYQLPSDKRFITMPIFKKPRPEGEQGEIVSFATRPYAECTIFMLQNEHVVVVIGGPPGSGKSTVTASLAAEMRLIIESLKSRTGWGLFDLRVAPVTLDLGTPTLEAILTGSGRDRERLNNEKRPWTKELALEALAGVFGASKKANIIIADLPGKIDDLTEMMAACGTIGVLVVRDWAQVFEWRRLFTRLGVHNAGELKSGERSSIITEYQKGRFISGRLEPLDRLARSWDRTISWLAELLLFDLLPSLVLKRRQRIEYALWALGDRRKVEKTVSL